MPGQGESDDQWTFRGTIYTGAEVISFTSETPISSVANKSDNISIKWLDICLNNFKDPGGGYKWSLRDIYYF